MTFENPELEAPPTDDLENDEGNNICETDDSDPEIDYESDCDLNHNLVGRKIKVIYDYDWYTGSISWFNNKIQKLCVTTEDIDGVEISLI